MVEPPREKCKLIVCGDRPSTRKQRVPDRWWNGQPYRQPSKEESFLEFNEIVDRFIKRGEFVMQYKGYTGILETLPGQTTFFGRVTGIKDRVTFQGKTIDEVVQSFHDSVDDYLEFCAERRESPEKPVESMGG